MALGDIYELKHIIRDADQKNMENVYFYRHVADPAGGTSPTQAQRLAQDWNTDFLTTWLANTATGYTTSEIRVRNLFNAADAYVMPLNRVTSRTAGVSEQLPSWMSVIATLAGDNPLVKKGRKMMMGIYELDQNFGILQGFGSPFFAVRAALALAGISNLFGGAKAFEPVIVKRVREGTPGNYTYRLPETQIEAIYANIVSATVSAVVTSQDTRKK